MMLSVDLMSNEPIYQQIRQRIVHAVAEGELVPGDSLPSVRSLASDLGVNMHTVNKAYALLRDEGYVVMRRRSGAVVADRASVISPERQQVERDRMDEALRKLAVEYKAQGGNKDAFLALAASVAKRVYGTDKEG